MLYILSGIPGKPFKVLRNSGIPQDYESADSGILQILQLSFLEILKFLGTQFSVGHGGGGGYYLLTNWLAYLYGRIQSPRPDVMPDRREGITRAAGFVFACIDMQTS